MPEEDEDLLDEEYVMTKINLLGLCVYEIF